MKKISLFLLFLVPIYYFSQTEKAEPFFDNVINGIPSASGVEQVKKYTYIVGDDSPYLFKLKNNKVISRYLIDSAFADSTKIHWSVKPDFESIAKKGNKLYVFGSGSINNTRRDQLIIFDLQTKKNTTYSLTKLYELIREKLNRPFKEFNIEGATFTNHQLILGNRLTNTLISLSITDFETYLHNNLFQPSLSLQTITLPKDLKNFEATLSGLSYNKKHNTLLYSASVEIVPPGKYDGTIEGSFMGEIDLKTHQTKDYLISKNNTPKRIKIEGITQKGNTIILVTDSDGGNSEWLEIKKQ